jgi:hypothetical protein
VLLGGLVSTPSGARPFMLRLANRHLFSDGFALGTTGGWSYRKP